VFLLDKTIKKYDLYITPWLGLGVIVLALTLLSHLGFSVEDCAVFFLVSIAIINSVTIFWKRERIYTNKKDLLLFLVILSIYFFRHWIAGIMNLHDSYYINIYNNNDFMSYLNVAKYFLTETINTPIRDGLPMQGISIVSTTLQTRNEVFFFALFSYLFKQDLLYCVYPITLFISSLNTMMFRLFLGDKTKLVLPLLVILSFNPLYLWLLNNGFIGQIFSLGVSIVILFLCNSLSELDSFNLKSSVLIGVLLIVQSYIYMEGLPWSGAYVVFLGAQTLIKKGTNKTMLFLDIALIAGIFLIFNFNNFLIFIKVFLGLNNTSAGWEMPLGTLFEVFLDYRVREFIPRKFFLVLSITANVLILGVFSRTIKKVGLNSYLSVALIGNLLLYILIFILYYDKPVGSYKIWKAFVSVSPIIVVFVLHFAREYLSSNISQE
jgi:hypothetical protein